VLPASGTASARHPHPVLGRPPDLVTVARDAMPASCACREDVVGRVHAGRLVPYYSRAEIEGGAVSGAPVLGWIADPLDLFLLQIQGSGVLVLDGGTRRSVGFAASNGRPYVSIGKLLIERGELPANGASLDAIRSWIEAHPSERQRLLQENPRYVFFRELPGPALGSLGVPVSAGRTIATDPSVYPEGALALIRIEPGDAMANGFERLVLNQDAGAAIRGPGRVDVFLGEGPEAGTTAGRLRAHGELYFLAPRLDGTGEGSEAIERDAAGGLP
jgi:membrane-bound lytic murein transglycosylase A